MSKSISPDISDLNTYEIQVTKTEYSMVKDFFDPLKTEKSIKTESFVLSEGDLKRMSVKPEISLCGLKLTLDRIEVQDD